MSSLRAPFRDRLVAGLLPLAAAGLLVPAGARAEIQVKTLADGTKMIFNEDETHRARRSAGSLLAVPRYEIGRLIDVHARRTGLDPRLVQAVVQVESGYNPRARSNKGAMGLMQLMPGTARELQVSDPYDPEDNIRGGTTYLRRMLAAFGGDLQLALAAYNAGPTAVGRFDGIPPYRETHNYVYKVVSLYRGRPPTSMHQRQALARDEAQRRRQTDAQPAAVEAPRGAKVYVTRDEHNRIVFTTKAPGSR